MKSIEPEVEKAIILALVQYEVLSFNKLKFLEGYTKYGTGTLCKYLDKLSEEGTIQIEQEKTGRKEIKIWLDPEDRTVIRQFIEMMEKSGKATDDLVEVWIRFLDKEQNSSKHDKASVEIETIFHDSINGFITSWFRNYFYVIFMSTTGYVPAAMGKYFMLNYGSQLKKIEKLLKKIKKARPDTYELFMHHASRMVFRKSI